MEFYVYFMNFMSIFGIIVLFVSVYFIICVPSKLNSISFFAIHGHEISAGICQIFLTVGVTPASEFPCAAGFPQGLFTRLNVMSTLTQTCSQIVLYLVIGWFVALLSLIRVFAVSLNLSERTKKIMIYCHSAHLIVQIFVFFYAGLKIENAGAAGLSDCLTRKPHLRQQMFTDAAIYFLPEYYNSIYFFFSDVILFVSLYAAISLICGIILIRSLHSQGKTAKSQRYTKNQRNLTTAILFLIALEMFGLAAPSACIMGCFMFKIGTPIVADLCFVVMSIYPIMGCLCMWFATPVYKDRIFLFLRELFPKLFPKKVETNITVLRTTIRSIARR